MTVPRPFAASCLVCFAGLAIALPGGRAAAADSPCSESTSMTLEVIAELGDEADDAAMREYLSARVPARLAETAEHCVTADADRTVVAHVAWSNADEGSYAIQLRGETDCGASFDLPPGTCEACGTSDVLDIVVRSVPAVLHGLRDPSPPPPPELVHEPKAAPVRAPAPVLPLERPRLGVIGRAGVGVLSVGLVAIAAGAALWGRRAVTHPDDPRYRVVLSPAGIAMVTLGVAATTTGGTMVAMELTRPRRFAFVPHVGRGRAGISVAAAF